MDQPAIVVAIKQLVASIGDAHTGFGFSSAPPMNFFVFPIKVYRYPDGVYVQAAAPAYRNLVGGRIVSIGGVTMDRAEARLNSVADASNVWTKRWWLPFTFRGAVFKALGLSSTATSARFEIELGGHSESVELPVVAKPFSLGYALGAPAHSDWVDDRSQTAPLYLQHLERQLWFTPAPDGVLYVRCSIVGDTDDESFAAFFARVFSYVDQHSVSKFVLDLRMNGGGDNQLTPIVTEGILRRPALNRRGNLFVVIGRSTQSAAENLVDRLQRDTQAVFVGEPTGERPNMYGDPQPFILPASKIEVNVSSLYWQDMGPRDNRDTTGPEIAAELTERAFESGVDPAMDAIERFASVSFVASMEDAASKGDGALRAAYAAYVDAPDHRFAQVESSTEDVISTLIDAKRYDSAAVLCALNIRRYSSASAYDALGSLADARKDAVTAKSAYFKALQLDPRDAAAASRLSALSAQAGPH